MTAMLIFSLYNLLDSIWLTRLGPKYIAAYTVTFPLQMLIIALGIGTGVGAGSFAARMLGAKDREQAERTAGQGTMLALVVGAILIAVIHCRPDDILLLCGGCKDILPLTRDYVLTMIWGVPCHFFLNMATNLFRADGRPTEAMYVLLTFSLSGLIFDPLLIFGWGPLPPWGSPAPPGRPSSVKPWLLYFRLGSSFVPDHGSPRNGVILFPTGRSFGRSIKRDFPRSFSMSCSG